MPDFYMQRGDQEFGPFPASQLKQLADHGKVVPSDLIRQGEEGKWYTASTVKGLFSQELVEHSPDAQDVSPRSTPTEAPEPADTTPNLVACPDCGTMVSKRTAACPSCGVPLLETEDNPELKSCPDCETMVPEQSPACPCCGIPFWDSQRTMPSPAVDQTAEQDEVVKDDRELARLLEQPISSIAILGTMAILSTGVAFSILFQEGACFSDPQDAMSAFGATDGFRDAAEETGPGGTITREYSDTPISTRGYSTGVLVDAFQDWLADEDEYLAAYNRFKVNYSKCVSDGPSTAFLLKNDLEAMKCLYLTILFDDYLVVVAKACPEYDEKKRKWEEIAKDVVGRMKALPLLWIKNNRLNKSVLEQNLPTLRRMLPNLDSIENLLPPTDDHDDFAKNWLNAMRDAVENSGQ